MNPELQAFFESYREAFNRLDGEAIARLYAVPSGIASDRGYTHWSSFEPIVENMWVFRLIVTDDSGIVTAHSGDRDR